MAAPALHFPAVETLDTAKLQLRRPTRLGGHGSHHRGLVRRPAATLGPAATTADVGVIHLAQPAQLTTAVALQQGLHQLVADRPGRVLRHAEMTRQLQRRHPSTTSLSCLGTPSTRPETMWAGAVWWRGTACRPAARSDGGSGGTGITSGGAAHREGGVVALGADEATGPTQLGDGVTAGFDAAVPSLKFAQAESFLKLNVVLFHFSSTIKSTR